MAYKTRPNASSDAVNIKTLNVSDGKIDAVELNQLLTDIIDSSTWNDSVQALTSGTTVVWSCTNSMEASLSLGHNATLSITGLPTDGSVVYGTLRVSNTGSYALAMPSGSKTNGGTIGSGSGAVSFVTFRWDGTYIEIGIAQYS